MRRIPKVVKWCKQRVAVEGKTGFILIQMLQISNFTLGKSVNVSGPDFFSDINRDDDRCNLRLHWNKDFTKNTIKSYWDDNLTGKMFDAGLFKLTFEMAPYWKWKYGLKVSWKEREQAKKLDETCCPSKKIFRDPCSGPGVLGKPGTSCETISDACGDIKSEDMGKCVYFKRKHYAASIKNIATYYVYPIADKDGKPTMFYKHFYKTYEDHGITALFHPLEETS